jgi:(p)ppGpp synthase/HD superfamily hydrolase
MSHSHPLIKQCLKIASEAHATQVDKAKMTYLLHPIMVSLLVETHDRSVLKRWGSLLSEEALIEAQCVALLHDVLEDCPVTFEDLRDHHHLPLTICEAVLILTKADNEAYSDYLKRVKANPLSKVVKLADLLDNANLDRLPKVTQEDKARRLKYLKSMLYLWLD